jgi:hypothetical protein
VTARTLIVRFDVDVVPLAIKHRIEPQACINKSGTQRLSLCFRLHAHAPRLLVRVDARTIGRVGRVKCGYVGHERNGRQASAGGHLFRLFTKVHNLVSCMNYFFMESYFRCLSYDAKRQRTGVHGVSFSDSPGRVQPQLDRREGKKDFRYPFRNSPHAPFSFCR